MVHHRIGGLDHRGAAICRMALRPNRSTANLHGAFDSRLAARDGHRVGSRFRNVLAVPCFDWGHRCGLRRHPVPHDADVRRSLRRHGKCHDGRLGQLWRRRNAPGHAVGVRLLCFHAGPHSRDELAGFDGRGRRYMPGDGCCLLLSHSGHAARESSRSPRCWHRRPTLQAWHVHVGLPRSASVGAFRSLWIVLWRGAHDRQPGGDVLYRLLSRTRHHGPCASGSALLVCAPACSGA